MLRTVQLLPQKGFRHWASTRTVSNPSRQSATGLLTATRTGLTPASDDEHEPTDHPDTRHLQFHGAHERSRLTAAIEQPIGQRCAAHQRRRSAAGRFPIRSSLRVMGRGFIRVAP